MELRNFISQTLLDVITGVVDAQSKSVPGTVVPSGVKEAYKAVEVGISELQVIEFEVAVKADERSGSEAKISIVAAFAGGSVKGDSGKTSGHVATLKFRIPIRLPVSKATSSTK